MIPPVVLCFVCSFGSVDSFVFLLLWYYVSSTLFPASAIYNRQTDRERRIAARAILFSI